MGPQKIILFGGTFDPPHNGHMTLLAGAIEAVRPDLVLVEPAGTPPHKRAGGTSAAHRLAMCECFRPLFPELVLDTTEIARGGKSYTIDTVRQMNARYPGAQLYFPMGSDTGSCCAASFLWRTCARARTRLRCGNTRPGLRPRAARCCLPKRPCFPCPPPRCARWRQRAGRWTALCPKAWRRTLRGTIFIRPRPGRPDAPGCRTFEAHASAGPLRARIEAT